MALNKDDSFADPQARGIFPRQSEGFRRDVDGHQFCIGETSGQGKNDHPAPGADIEQTGPLRPAEITKVFHQLLGLRPGDKCPFVGEKNVLAEFNRAEEVLQGFPLGSPPDEIAERCQLGFGERSLKLQIKLDSFFTERMGDEVLCIQTRILDCSLLEVSGGGLENFENRHLENVILRATNDLWNLRNDSFTE